MKVAVDGRYKIGDLIGKGGMGEVYRAFDTHLGVERAIKLVPPLVAKGRNIPGAEDKRQAYVLRLRREAEATAKLAPNGNIVLVYDFIPAHDDTPDYIVMELLEGKLLSEILEKDSRLDPNRAVALMKDICAGVGAAHKRRIVHRDLNARNIIVCETSQGPSAKVIDFGLAKLPSDSDEMWTVITRIGEFMGTPAYAPPEQWLDSSDVDVRADVYSLGVLLYELLCGHTPFQARTSLSYKNKHMSASPARFPKALNIPVELEEVVRRALKKKPNQRQKDANELYQLLNAALEEVEQTKKSFEERKRKELEDEKRRRIETRIKRLEKEVAEQKSQVATVNSTLEKVEGARLLAEGEVQRLTSELEALKGTDAKYIAEDESEEFSPEIEDLQPNNPAAIGTFLNSVDPYKRAAAVAELARSGADDAFELIVNCFDDHSPHVRNAAARAFRKLEPVQTVNLFNRALESASYERRRNIGEAIAASGLATEAIDKLDSENREDTYNALSLLFVMAKIGEFDPLVQAIEGHESVQVRMAAIKLLTLTGQSELANAAAKRRVEKQPVNEE